MGVRRRGSQRQKAAKQGKDAEGATPTAGASKAARNGASETPNLMPTLEEVLDAIESLYEDELKPFGRILRKRVAERASGTLAITIPWVPGSEDNLPDVDIKHLKSTCEDSECITVEPEEGGDWSAILVGRPQSFVNVYSPSNDYPIEMWEAAASYFQALEEKDMYLPGGRYSCAQALQARCLPFLVGRSLGQVCHIVQLAISQKKILGYSNGAVVPYEKSQSMVKEQCAMNAKPCSAQAAAVSSDSTSAMPMATWEKARRCLRDILDAAQKSPEGEGMVPLSNVKRLFRSRYQTELSETMLGHSKLSELLQDEQFSDICTVQLQGHGYIVVQVQSTENQPFLLSDTLPIYGGEDDDQPRRIELGIDSHLQSPFRTDEPLILEADEETGVLEACPSPKSARKPRWPLSPSRLSNDGLGNHLVQRTFIHASPPPPTPPPNARRRSHSLPKDVGSDKSEWESSCSALKLVAPPMEHQIEATESTNSTADSALGSVGGRCVRAPSSPSPSSEIHSYSADQSPALDDPVKVQLRECHLGAAVEPVKIGEPGDFMDFGVGGFSDRAEACEPLRRPQFCVDEPLALEEAVFLEPAPRAQTPKNGTFSAAPVPRWSCLSPGLLVKDGCVGSMPLSKVQNTFIHSPLLPPTPLRASAARRSRSLPKNVGSDKNAWEATCQALGCGPGQISLGFHPENDFPAGDCGPSPSVFRGYAGPEMPCSLASSPAYVPPSPALTASPTYCSARHPGPQRLVLAAATGPPSPSHRVLCLSDLLQ